MSHRKHRRTGRRAHRTHVAAPGAPPGTLIVDPASKPPEIHLIAYGPDCFQECKLRNPADVAHYLGCCPIVWIDVEGLGDVETIRTLGKLFKLHPLALEDVLNAYQRPKVEQYGEHYFMVAHMAARREHLETEQLSLFLGRNFVLTLQDSKPGDCLEPVRQRLRAETGRIRQGGPDHLAYAILDAVVDSNFPVLEQFGELLDELEDRVLSGPDATVMARLHETKRELLHLRRAVWPLRDALYALLRDSTPAISEETKIYLRDCHDHSLRIIELLENDREICSDLVDLYLSSVSNRMNEVMKVLTVFSAVFIPLTFIAGVYGMNFDRAFPLNMPELGWPYGYPATLAGMAAVAGALMYFFWRKGWLAPLNPRNADDSAGRSRD